ncbi:MAG: hypothetical protein KKH88_01610 [Nanoarchaeota archaeon]|nr:hypothetical protein [Nanoarchaeota archaeon]
MKLRNHSRDALLFAGLSATVFGTFLMALDTNRFGIAILFALAFLTFVSCTVSEATSAICEAIKEKKKRT